MFILAITLARSQPIANINFQTHGGESLQMFPDGNRGRDPQVRATQFWFTPRTVRDNNVKKIVIFTSVCSGWFVVQG